MRQIFGISFEILKQMVIQGEGCSRLLDNEKTLVKVLSKKKFSCRMNNNVINAIERILNEPELINL